MSYCGQTNTPVASNPHVYKLRGLNRPTSSPKKYNSQLFPFRLPPPLTSTPLPSAETNPKKWASFPKWPSHAIRFERESVVISRSVPSTETARFVFYIYARDTGEMSLPFKLAFKTTTHICGSMVKSRSTKT